MTPTEQDKDELRLKIKAVVGGIHTRSEYEELLLDIALTYASQREIEAEKRVALQAAAKLANLDQKILMLEAELKNQKEGGTR